MSDLLFFENENKLSNEEIKSYFEEFSGCVDRNIDLKKELEEWRDDYIKKVDK